MNRQEIQSDERVLILTAHMAHELNAAVCDLLRRKKIDPDLAREVIQAYAAATTRPGIDAVAILYGN